MVDDFGNTSISSNTVSDRLDKIARGLEIFRSWAPNTTWTPGKATTEHEFVLNGPWDTETFVFRASPEPLVDIKVEAGDDVEYAVVNVFGGTLYGPLTGRHFRTR